MDTTIDVQSPWPMPGVSFDFLDDIDAAPLDLFGVVGAFDEGGSSGCTTSDAVPHVITGRDASEHNSLTLAPTQQKDRKTAVKELNKRAQRRFREKQKTKWQRLQEELDASTAAVARLQSENKQIKSQNNILEKVAQLQNTEQLARQQVTLKPSLSNTLASIIGGDKPPLICTVNHTEETLSVYQVARMPPQQLAILWQDYVRELAICLATGGEVVRWEVDSPIGLRMTALHNELCQLCACKAAADMEGHKAFVGSPLLPALNSSAPTRQADPDWLKLGQNLKLSEEQLHNLFLLRRAYLQKQALILGYQHDLQLQQEGGGQQGAPGLQPVHYMHQMQDFALQLNEAFMQYMGTLYTGILTVWQASMAMVSSFPHPPDRLKDIVDALAEERGEPSAASFQAASADATHLDTWASLDDHIFKSKLNHPLPIQAAG